MSEWPELPIGAWRDTYQTLHLYTQVVGKIRLALTPRVNEWWNVPLYVTARGLTTSPMPYRGRTFSIDFDFIDHRLLIQDSDGRVRTVPLVAQCVGDFYAAVFAELKTIDVEVRIHAMPQECPVVTPLGEDTEHKSYDRDQVRRFFDVLSRAL